MITAGLSRRYAKAIFQLAAENRNEERISGEMQRFSQALTSSPLGAVLINPAYELTKRKRVLDEVAKSLQISPLVRRFLFLLLERRRLDSLPAIVAHYGKLLNEQRGRVDARALSAAPLDTGALDKVRTQLKQISGKEVILQSETAPELIAGLIVEIEGTTYDGSVRAHLEALRDMIEQGY